MDPRLTHSGMTKRRGFTLIEIIISVVILSLMAVFTAPLMATTIDMIMFHMTRVDIRESSSVALYRMSREIRRLKDDQSIVTATAAQFSFIALNGSQIRYQLTGNTLMRSLNGGADVGLADKVQAATLSFTYYDEDGNTIASPQVGVGVRTNVRRVGIKMTFLDGTQSLPIQTLIVPRNLPHESKIIL